MSDLAVVGLGYVGLPLAQAACNAGLSVVGFDVSTAVVDGLRSGRSHIDDLDDDEIARMLDQGFDPTIDPTKLGGADTIVICVPTPLSHEGLPDLGPVNSATATVASQLREGQLVVLESTTYPGTTEELLLPPLESTGFEVGKDFFLAYSPERVDPGNLEFGIKNTPKVVGGISENCSKKVAEFYSQFIDQVVVAKGTREAETAKLLENTYRHINIALVNEMARFSHDLGIDLWDVIRCASTKPFGFQAFYPGPGVGGHCIPIDPNYLAADVKSKLRYPFRFVELAQEINAGMPAYVVRRAQDELNEVGKPLKGATVLILGVTYKPNISDQRESPATEIGQKLLDKGAKIEYFDPFVPEWKLPTGEELESVDPGRLAQVCSQADLTLLIQNHDVVDIDLVVAKSQRVLDTRGHIGVSSKVAYL